MIACFLLTGIAIHKDKMHIQHIEELHCGILFYFFSKLKQDFFNSCKCYFALFSFSIKKKKLRESNKMAEPVSRANSSLSTFILLMNCHQYTNN